MIIDDPETVAEVENIFREYEAALVRNDLEALRTLFWADDRTLRYGDAENLYGAAEIAAFRAARPPGPRPREIFNTRITTYGKAFASANTEFRLANSDRLGRQSQTWVKLPQGWKVVAAHVSYI